MDSLTNGDVALSRFQWRTSGPHPVLRPEDYRTPSHDDVEVVYEGTPLVTLEAKLLFVREHKAEGWKLRWVDGDWRPVHETEDADSPPLLAPWTAQRVRLPGPVAPQEPKP